jgi:hypothetical protein
MRKCEVDGESRGAKDPNEFRGSSIGDKRKLDSGYNEQRLLGEGEGNMGREADLQDEEVGFGEILGMDEQVEVGELTEWQVTISLEIICGTFWKLPSPKERGSLDEFPNNHRIAVRGLYQELYSATGVGDTCWCALAPRHTFHGRLRAAPAAHTLSLSYSKCRYRWSSLWGSAPPKCLSAWLCS